MGRLILEESLNVIQRPLKRGTVNGGRRRLNFGEEGRYWVEGKKQLKGC
jgi:hypothetical protein